MLLILLDIELSVILDKAVTATDPPRDEAVFATDPPIDEAVIDTDHPRYKAVRATGDESKPSKVVLPSLPRG